MEKDDNEELPDDFIRCVEKLLSSISTLNKHLSLLIRSETNEKEELTTKLQAIKDAITSLAPAVETARQLALTSSIVDKLTTNYSKLCEDYKEHFAQIMTETRPFQEYKEYIERLSTWLASTNANIREVLQSVNKQRALLIIKNLDELSKYKSLLERATVLNRTMVADLPVEQATTMRNEMNDVKEQWRILIEGLNTLKERHASRYASPEPTSQDEERLARQNENLLHYIEGWINVARQLIKQEQEQMINDNDNENLLDQIQECEREILRLKTLLDEDRQQRRHGGEVTRSLADELEQISQSLTNSRHHLETRLSQEQALEREVDSLIDWLNQFIQERSSNTDHQTIELALKERQGHFDELIHCHEHYHGRLKTKIDHLIQRWNELSSLIQTTMMIINRVTTRQSAGPPSATDLSIKESEKKLLQQAEELLNVVAQLGNRHDIEQLNENIKTFLFHNDTQISSNLKVYLPDQVYEQLLIRQRVLQQMLIDTNQIDRLRVNFVAHFNTENDVIAASDQISSIIENYPREMTSELRHWLNEQQTSRLTAPLATVDSSKSIDDFQDYLKELEENLQYLEENENNDAKFKKVLQQIADRPSLPSSLSQQDRQRIEHLEERFGRLRARVEAIEQHHHPSSNNELELFLEHVDQLIRRVKEFEEEIRVNAIQPLCDYEQLIPDCQRLINELDRNLRLPVEQTITNGKRFYSTDNRDSSGMESADEAGPSSFPSPSPLLKKYPDLSSRKARRHVLQLTQRWKTANTNLRHRLKVLQRVEKTINDLRSQCDQIFAHLSEIDLAFAQQNQRRTLTIEQIPTEIDQTKHLFNNLMSCKTSLDDLHQSAQMIEGEYGIQMSSRVHELEEKWEHSVSAVTQRMQFLQDSVKNPDHDIYASSVEYPWQRAVAFNKVPYYINHTDQSTSWDHPKMLELIRSLSNLNDIRFSAYRTAMKLRTLQKRLCLDLTSLSDIISVFEETTNIDSPTQNLEKYIDVNEILNYLQLIFDKTAHEYPQMINVILTVDLTVNWLLNIYDVNRTGSIRLIAMKMALALLCRGNIEEKYRYIFSLTAYRSADQHDVVDRARLSLLFQQAIVIPKQLGEVAAFGGSSVEPSVKSCFDYAHNPDVITAEDFLEWVKLEPQSLVWLPVMHRLAASEAAKHEARCNICKIYPILGFRYRSLKYFNCDICQNCFFSGKQTKHFKMDDPLQEYYTETTSSEDIRDFFRIFKNKLWSKHRKHPKLGYLPLPHVFDNNLVSPPPSPAPSPILLPSISSPFKAEVFTPQILPPSSSSPIESADEHGIIAQHCRNLNSLSHASPRAAAHEILTRSRSLDHEQRNELEAIIRDLEDENRLLQMEYERLCQQHMEKSLRINEQIHRSDSQLGSLGYLNDYNSSDREMLREAKQLRHHKTKLEQRMKILEEHNKQLEKQLKRSKQLLFRESPASHHHHYHSNSSMAESRIPPSPHHNSNLALRRSVERNLERQPNLMTIDNLFHMADDINRAVGDLVSVITEPQTNGSSSKSSYYPPVESSLVA